jgi:hypothetical protein
MRLGRLCCSSGGTREPLRLDGPEPGASDPFRASAAGDFSRLTSILGASGALISGALISGTLMPGFLALSAYTWCHKCHLKTGLITRGYLINVKRIQLEGIQSSHSNSVRHNTIHKSVIKWQSYANIMKCFRLLSKQVVLHVTEYNIIFLCSIWYSGTKPLNTHTKFSKYRQGIYTMSYNVN